MTTAPALMIPVLRSARRVVSLATLLASSPCASALAQSHEVIQYAHTVWRHRDGFSKDNILAIAQTMDGYLWLGTRAGLLRFDGVRAVAWQPPEGQKLPHEYIYQLKGAKDGTLWISTRNGLASWKDGTLTSYADVVTPLASPIYEGSDGTIWFGLLNPGLLCSVRSQKVQCEGTGKLGNVVLDVLQDRKGNLWVAAETGLWRWAPGTPELQVLPDKGIAGRMVEDNDGALILEDIRSSRLLRLAGGAVQRVRVQGIDEPFTPSPETPDRIQLHLGMVKSRDGALWLPTSQGVVHLHKGRTDRFTVADGLSSDDVREFFEDLEGNIWVVTIEGLDRFSVVTAQTISARQGLSNPTVWAVQATADGAVWIATSAGLNRVAGDTLDVVVDANVQGAIHALGLDNQGRLLASTSRGLVAQRGNQFARIPGAPLGPVAAIASEDDRTYWVSSVDGDLYRWSSDGAVRRIDGGPATRVSGVRTLLSDPSGRIWLGLNRGRVGHIADGTVSAVDNDPDKRPYPASDLRLGSDGAVWTASPAGVTRVKDARTSVLNTRNGLPCSLSAAHWSIEDDDLGLWLYLACGLVRIEHSEWQAWVDDPKRTVKTTFFGSDDGVRTRGFGYATGPVVTKSTDGRIWFLVPNGVSVFDPRRLAINTRPPPVHIERIMADGKTYDQGSRAGERIRLAPSLRNLEIDYTATSLTSSEKVRFRVKLEGQDPDWREVANQRQVVYSNLAPGPYRFRVSASNNSGVWNLDGAVLDFDVAPAFYHTTWFRALSGGAFLAFVWGLHGLRVRQLALRERRFRDTLETMPAMTFTASPSGESTFVNRRWVDYTGLSLEHATGGRWQEVVHPADLDRVLDSWRDARATGEPMEYEVRLRDAAGAYRWFLVRAVPLRDKRGQVARWYGVATDIEERKHAEDDRRRSDEALDRARSDLAHVARVTSLGAMTASIAHEVNQPLSGIITNASACLRMLAADEPNIEGARETARRTIRDGNRAADVVTRLRALFTKKEVIAEPVDLNEAAREVLALSAGALQRKEVTVQADLADDLPRVIGDRVQLLQVILNLLLNASDAMSEIYDRPRRVAISTESEEPGHVRLVVKDEGVGIEPQALARLFEPFYTTKPNGMGIGLSVCRSIIERHRGRLWAEQNEGPGATFCVSLPCEPRGNS